MPERTATTNGGGELLRILHEVLNNKQADEMSLTAVPIFGKPFVFLIATRNQPSI
jgi:hypothetical protein